MFFMRQGNKFIGLVLLDEEKYAHEMSDSMRRMTRLNMKMGYPMLNITFRHIIEKEQLMKELDRHNPNVTIHFEEGAK